MIFGGWDGVIRIAVVGVLAYAGLIVLLRPYGKRTLAKMNAFDFVVTVALGSTLSGMLLNRDVALTDGLAAFAVLLSLQFAISWGSVRSRLMRRAVKSEPARLVRDGKVISAALRRERVTESEVEQAVRQSGAASVAGVDAVIHRDRWHVLRDPTLRRRAHRRLSDPLRNTTRVGG